MVKISIIVPVYNAERTLVKCIDSVIQQDFSEYELILINDGSQDDSQEIIDIYQDKNPCIKAYHKENEGVAATRNFGIECATGDYIFFVDSDDWLEEHALSKLYHVITKYKTDIIGFNSFIEKPGEQRCLNHINIEQYYEGEEINKIISQLSISFIWDKLFKRSIIIEHNIRFDEELSFGEDTLFYCDFLMHLQNTTVIPYYLYHYRQLGGNSLSSRYVQDMDNILQRIVAKHKLVCQRYPAYQTSLNQSLYYQIMCLQVIYDLYNDHCPLDANERRIKLRNYMSNELYKIIKSAKPTSQFKKCLILLYKLNNVYIMDACLIFLKVIRKKYKSLFEASF